MGAVITAAGVVTVSMVWSTIRLTVWVTTGGAWSRSDTVKMPVAT